LAVLFRRRPSEIAAWPASEVRLLEHYLAKQPAPEERVELILARLTSIYINAHLKEGAKPSEPIEHLRFLDPWPEPMDVGVGRYSALDLEIMRGLK
jgi:hypothetical protein